MLTNENGLALTAQKMNFFMKDFFSKCDQIRSFLPDLVTFTEEILNGKLYFLCSACLNRGLERGSNRLDCL